MPLFDPPEIHENDLMPVVLDCASWGIIDPRQLAWLDQPTPAAVQDAHARLEAIGAMTSDGRIADHGRGLAAIPLPVPLAHMLAAAGEGGAGDRAATLAVLLTEPGLGGRDVDIERRWANWRGARGERAQGAARLVQRLAKLAPRARAGQDGDDLTTGALLALAFPERVACQRDGRRGEYLSVGGRAFRLDPSDSLANERWLVIADAQGRAGGARILSAAAIAAEDVEQMFAAAMQERRICRYDTATDRVEQLAERRLGAIKLTSKRAERSAATIADDVAARLAHVGTHGLSSLAWGTEADALRRRAAFADIATLANDTLLAQRELWLAPLLEKTRGLRDIADRALADALLALLDWPTLQALDRIAPSHFASPAGANHRIDYGAEGGPLVTLRVQELFGQSAHPTVGQPPVALVLALTSPAHRPIQLTRDLPGFWAGSWRDVQREMKGRYPRHNWPDDPASARASVMTKAAQARRDGA
jgi:ATP-dependent helicase HrpB